MRTLDSLSRERHNQISQMYTKKSTIEVLRKMKPF